MGLQQSFHRFLYQARTTHLHKCFTHEPETIGQMGRLWDKTIHKVLLNQLLCKLVDVEHASTSTAWSVTINHQVLVPSLLQPRVYHDVSSRFDDFFTDCGSTSAGEGAARGNQALGYLCITYWSRRSSSKCCNPCGA